VEMNDGASRVLMPFTLANPAIIRYNRAQSAERIAQSAERRAQSAERRAQSAERNRCSLAFSFLPFLFYRRTGL
jgi:hypothetical protein